MWWTFLEMLLPSTWGVTILSALLLVVRMKWGRRSPTMAGLRYRELRMLVTPLCRLSTLTTDCTSPSLLSVRAWLMRRRLDCDGGGGGEGVGG